MGDNPGDPDNDAEEAAAGPPGLVPRAQFKSDARVVQSQILKGALIVSAYEKGRSEYWKSDFGIVTDKKGTYAGFASCYKCSTLIPYKLGSATTSLLRHQQVCVPTLHPPQPLQPPPACTSASAAATSGAGSSSSSSGLTVTQWKNKLTCQAANTSCAEVRPFLMYEGEEYLKLAQVYMDAARQHPSLTAQQLTPCATTVSRKVKKICVFALLAFWSVKRLCPAGFRCLSCYNFLQGGGTS